MQNNYWLPKLHKNPYKSRFISNSSHCSTTIRIKHLTSSLTAVKDYVKTETAFSNSNVNYFWSIKLFRGHWKVAPAKCLGFSSFSTLYTSSQYDLIKGKVLSLDKWCFNRESKTYLCTSDKVGLFSNKKYDSYKCWTCTEFGEAFTSHGGYLYAIWWHGIPTNSGDSYGHKLCSAYIADLFLYCYERYFMSNLQKSKRFDLIDKFNETSRYFVDIFNFDNPEFAQHIPDIHVYLRELQLNKANTSDKKNLSWT